MRDISEHKGREPDEESSTDDGARSSTPKGMRSGTRRNTVVAVVAIVAIAALALILWRFGLFSKSTAGRPVPIPRQVTTGQKETNDATKAPVETTLTLSPEVASHAGIKIEQVGEQPTTVEGTAGLLSTGVVQPNTYRTTPVISLVGGIVRSVNAELGQGVKAGQQVAVVFSDELAMAQSRYLTAIAELDEHHKHHRRIMELVEIGAASREEMEQATTKLRSAESEVASLRQRLLLFGLSQQRVNSLKSSSQISSEIGLPSPVSGTVIGRSANPGEVIEANKEILRVADLSSVWVVGQVYEKDLASIQVGSGASITSDAYPGRVFRGRITYVDPSLDPTTRTAQARIELGNPGQALKIGMYVNVAFTALGASQITGVVIPSVAVQNINNQQVVFVVTSDPNVFVIRPVRLGPETNGRYAVLEGLSVSERIVTEGSFMLRAEWLKLNPKQP